ncbi:reverse transcriptase domain-containing protein [Tanacetum coccineum]
MASKCKITRKLKEATRKRSLPIPIHRPNARKGRSRNEYNCFLDGFSRVIIQYSQYDPKDQEKTTFNAHKRNFCLSVACLLGYANAPGTFQRCMITIFHDIIAKMMEVFMDTTSFLETLFSQVAERHLEKMLKRCEDTNLSLNWEKSHFMVKEGIVLGHKISKSGLEVDRAKVEVIAKLPHCLLLSKVSSEVSLRTASFSRRFIQDFSQNCPTYDSYALKKRLQFVLSLEECDKTLCFWARSLDIHKSCHSDLLGEPKCAITHDQKNLRFRIPIRILERNRVRKSCLLLDNLEDALIGPSAATYKTPQAGCTYKPYKLVYGKHAYENSFDPINRNQEDTQAKDQKQRFQRMYSRIMKALDSVIFNSSFTSSASFWESSIQI